MDPILLHSAVVHVMEGRLEGEMYDPLAVPIAQLAEIDQVERSLLVLASVLRRVPVEARTRALHMRAIAMNKEIETWHERDVSAELRRAALAELAILIEQARAAFAELPSGRQLARRQGDSAPESAR